MAEWSIAAVLKTASGESLTGVRIPPSPILAWRDGRAEARRRRPNELGRLIECQPGEPGQIKDFVKKLLPILIWVVVIGALFALAWWKGYVVRLRNYWNSMLEELRKCAWPTWDELKGSTIIVTITIALLGAFCYGVDTIFYYVVKWITVSVS